MKTSGLRTEVKDYSTQLGDQELVAGCLNGDPAAWETLIKRYHRLIYSIPLKSGLPADDAADVFQSVCVKLLEKLTSLRNHDKLSSWLITTTTRECWRVSSLKRRSMLASNRDRDEGLDGINEAAATEPLADEEREALERQQMVRDAIAILPDRCRELITMLFYLKDELSYADVARRMKMPVASVGPTRARCLQKLKKLLDGKL